MSTEQNFLLANRCSGGEKCKVRLTGMVAATTTCKKLPIFVIGKSKNHRFLTMLSSCHAGMEIVKIPG